MRQHYAETVKFPLGDEEVSVVACYTFVPGAKPSVSSLDGGDPGYDPELDVYKVTLFEGGELAAPPWLQKKVRDWVQENCRDELVEATGVPEYGGR